MCLSQNLELKVLTISILKYIDWNFTQFTIVSLIENYIITFISFKFFKFSHIISLQIIHRWFLNQENRSKFYLERKFTVKSYRKDLFNPWHKKSHVVIFKNPHNVFSVVIPHLDLESSLIEDRFKLSTSSCLSFYWFTHRI